MKFAPQLLAYITALLIAASAWAEPKVTVSEQIVATLDQLETDGDFESASVILTGLFDQVAVHTPVRELDTFRQVALAVRMVDHLSQVNKDIRIDVLKLLRANPRLAQTLCFLVDTEHQQPSGVYTLLHRLGELRGDMIERYATLTAAVCVVHDRPLQRRINENLVHAPDPLYVFDYFVKHESRMMFGIREMPPQLLVYVVDVTTSLDELIWAQNRHAGDANVGRRFFDISYDHAHFRDGRPKRVTEEGFTLQNIRRFGGVCADQSYYAMMVGKSIGIPTTYNVGRSSDVSHAWVGFLEADRHRAWWNFDSGRYEAYQGVRGNVMNPQTRQNIPDSHISMLAGLARVNETSRFQAAALVDAALHLGSASQRPNFDPPPPSQNARARPRSADLNGQLVLLEAALREAPQYDRGWFVVRDLAGEGGFTLQQKRQWATALHRLCGNEYLDFQLAILVPMIKNVEDVNAQNRLWEAAFERFSPRHDLAAEIRMHQGHMWEAAGNLNRAGICFEDVILRYANTGHFIVHALHETERLLRSNNRESLIPELYANAWSQIDRPQRMAEPFIEQSNWVVVGRLYANRLQHAGRSNEASRVLRQLNVQ